MTDDELDALVASALPVTPGDVAALQRAVVVGDLTKEVLSMADHHPLPHLALGPDPAADRVSSTGDAGPIVELPSPAKPGTVTAPATARPARRIGVLVAAGSLLVAGTALGLRYGGSGSRVKAQPGTSAPTTEVAPANSPTAPAGTGYPVLLQQPGWTVSYLAQRSPTQGEIHFRKGATELDVRWDPADQFQGYLGDRQGSEPSGAVTLTAPGGVTARGFPSQFTALWLDGQRGMEAQSSGFASYDDYKAAFAGLALVDANTWLAALPAGYVHDDSDPAAIDQVLTGVPRPPGFTPATTGLAQDPYDMGADVTAGIACGWVDTWIADRATGDVAGAKAAVEAMTGARSWPILQSMDANGGWSSVLWEYADDMQAIDGGHPGRHENGPGPAGLRQAMTSGLGCAPPAG